MSPQSPSQPSSRPASRPPSRPPSRSLSHSPFIPARPADPDEGIDDRTGAVHGTAIIVSPPPRRAEPPSPVQPRLTLTFVRTELGDVNAERGCPQFDRFTARLLLLLDTPLTTQEIGDIINEPWIPAALIELERHRLIRRVDTTELSGPQLTLRSMRSRFAGRPWPAVRDHVRHHFEILLGSLGASMGRRIVQCTTPDELEDLMPQLEALVEAVAGHAALDEFLHATGTNTS